MLLKSMKYTQNLFSRPDLKNCPLSLEGHPFMTLTKNDQFFDLPTHHTILKNEQ